MKIAEGLDVERRGRKGEATGEQVGISGRSERFWGRSRRRSGEGQLLRERELKTQDKRQTEKWKETEK